MPVLAVLSDSWRSGYWSVQKNLGRAAAPLKGLLGHRVPDPAQRHPALVVSAWFRLAPCNLLMLNIDHAL